MNKTTVQDLAKYMNDNDIPRVAVEAVNRNVPEWKQQYYTRKPYILPHRMIIVRLSSLYNSNGKQFDIHYAAQPSFKTIRSSLPAETELILLDNEDGHTLINEYNDYVNGLEKAFDDAFNAVNPEINAKVEQIVQLLHEVKQLSKSSGVPIKFAHDNFYLEFTPESCQEKFGNSEAVREMIGDVTGVYVYGDASYDSWRHSSIC